MAHQNYQPIPASCTISGTLLEIIAIRDAGQLVIGCHYLILDVVQGNFLAGTTVLLRAVAVDELSIDGTVNSLFDNSGWACEYDIDTANFLAVTDNLNNDIRSAVLGNVSLFDWGNALVTGNTSDGIILMDAAVLYQMRNNTIGASGTLNLTGHTLGNITNNTIDGTFNNSTGTLRLDTSRIEQGSIFQAPGFGVVGLPSSVVECQFAGTVNITLGPLAGQIIWFESMATSGSNIIHNAPGGFGWRRSQLSAQGLIRHNNTAGLLTITGGTIIGGQLDHSPTGLIPGDLNFITSVIENSQLNYTSSLGAAGVNVSVLNSGIRDFSTVALGGAGRLTVNSCSVFNSTIAQGGTALMAMLRTNILSGSRVISLVGCLRPISFQESTISNFSRFTAFGAAATEAIVANMLTMDNGSVINVTSAAGLITLTETDLNTAASIIFPALSQRSLTMVRNVLSLGTVVNMNAQVTGLTTFQSSVIEASVYTETLTTPGAAVIWAALNARAGSSIVITGPIPGFVGQFVMMDTSVLNINNLTQAVPDFAVVSLENSTFTYGPLTVTKTINRIYARSNSVVNLSGGGGGIINDMSISEGSNYTATGLAGAAQYVVVGELSAIEHNGGTLVRCRKTIGGTLTTGAFNHVNIIHDVGANKTLTVANANRADYMGLAVQLI